MTPPNLKKIAYRSAPMREFRTLKTFRYVAYAQW